VLTVLDGEVAAAPLRWTRWLLGVAALVTAWDAWIALHEAADGLPIRTFRSLPRVDGAAITVVAALFVVGGLLLLADRAARAGSALVGITAAATIVGEQLTYSNHWVLLIATSLLFALVPRPATGATTVPYWPVFLLRVQLSSVYLYTAIAKLNASYFTGRPLKWGTISIIDENVPEKVFVVLSAGLLLVEAFLAVALWIPRLRRFAIPLGVLLHVSIVLAGADAVELVAFQLTSLAIYPLFTRDPAPIAARRATPAPA